MALLRRGPVEVVDPSEVAAALADQHAADIVDVLNQCELPAAGQLLALLPVNRAVEVLDQPALSRPAELLQSLEGETASTLLGSMSPDRAADLLRHLEEPQRSRFLARLTTQKQDILQRLLAYPAHTAGSVMTTDFVAVPATWTVGETIAHLRTVDHLRDTINAVHVFEEPGERLVKVTSLRQLLFSNGDTSIHAASRERRLVTVNPFQDREDVARLMSKYDLLAVPVVDDAGKAIGIVTVDDIMDVMIAESSEDLQKFGGMESINRPYLDIGFGEMIRKRGGWLAALFVGEMLTASVMQFYEAALAQAIVLALFIPLIMSSGGNSGSQAGSLLTRALALQQVRLGDWWRVVVRELPVGLTLGALLGVVGMARIMLWHYLGLYDYGEHWMLIALTIGAALVGVVTFGSLAGTLLPFGLQALKLDPATASAPLVATLVDVTGIAIYLSIALLILSGTVL